jgi:hypothetical protein
LQYFSESKLDKNKQNQQSDALSKTIGGLQAKKGLQNGTVSTSNNNGRQELPIIAAPSATFPAFSSAVQIQNAPNRGR